MRLPSRLTRAGRADRAERTLVRRAGREVRTVAHAASDAAFEIARLRYDRGHLGAEFRHGFGVLQVAATTGGLWGPRADVYVRLAEPLIFDGRRLADTGTFVTLTAKRQDKYHTGLVPVAIPVSELELAAFSEYAPQLREALAELRAMVLAEHQARAERDEQRDDAAQLAEAERRGRLGWLASRVLER